MKTIDFIIAIIFLTSVIILAIYDFPKGQTQWIYSLSAGYFSGRAIADFFTKNK